MKQKLIKSMILRLTESDHEHLTTEANRLQIPILTVARLYIADAITNGRSPLTVGGKQPTTQPSPIQPQPETAHD